MTTYIYQKSMCSLFMDINTTKISPEGHIFLQKIEMF